MNRYDVIVVGAGPAGITAAHALAKSGLKVVVFERGEYPGAKNMFGGVFYHGEVLAGLIPEFWKQAPVERFISRRVISFMTPKSSISLDYRNSSFAEPPYNGFTLLRSKFDRWCAEEAEKAGAFIVTETVVDDVIAENGKVVGVKARRDSGEVYGNIVIAADGVNSFLAHKAGLRKEFSGKQLAVGVKEVISLPAGVIEERFGISGNEGVASEYVGSCTEGVEGGGFLYTNRDSLSLGVVANVSSLTKSKKTIAQLLEDFKAHPLIRDLVKDGALKEYGGHLIPEAGASMSPKLYTDGMIVAGDAAGFVCNTGLTLEGVNFAMASGLAAAQAAQVAHSKGDFSRTALAHYEELLKSSFVLQDLQTFRGAPQVLGNHRLYDLYPELVCGVAERLFRVDGKPRKKIGRLLREQIKEQNTSIWDLIGDGVQGGKTLIWP